MDTVMLNRTNSVLEETSIMCPSEDDKNPNHEMYSSIINNSTYNPLLKNELIYNIEEQALTVSNEDYQSALKCFNTFQQKCNVDPNEILGACNNKDYDSSISKEKQNLTINYSTGDRNKSFNCLNNRDLLSPDILKESHNDVLKTQHSNSFRATDDESMAVEALRQLGGMYNNVVTDQVLPMLCCNSCGGKFQTTTELQAHNVECKRKASVSNICSVCKGTFENKQDYNNHDCQKRFICRFCSNHFYNLSDLQTHIDSNHQGDRPYKCHVCNLRFPRPSSLTNHLKIHNYQPGRALLNGNIPTPTSTHIWHVEHPQYISEVTNNISEATNNISEATNNSTSDLLANWTYYENVNQDISLPGPEMVVETTFGQSSPDIDNIGLYQINEEPDYQIPVKVEIIPLVDVEKGLDETFPISSIPQMEVTVSSDDKKPHVCSHCGVAFTRAKALISHLKLHNIGWPATHECDTCGEALPNEHSKIQHNKHCFVNNTSNNLEQTNKANSVKKIAIKLQPKVGKYPCPDCDKRFATKQKMFRHMWIHRKKTFTCELCAMTFEVQIELDKHRLSQHRADSPYVCQECGKWFASRQGLWEHGRVHGNSSAGLFSCNQCNKTFASRQGYLIHNRTHTGERPYGCRFCLKAFRDGGTLRKHERIHTGERPHVCPICLHDFNQKVVLREHVRWVHTASKTENEKGFFVCPVCSVNVSDREELCAHIVKHSDQMAAETKDSNTPLKRAEKRVKKLVQKKQNSAVKVENSVRNTPEKKKLYLASNTALPANEINTNQIDCSPEQTAIECDMCGNRFQSHKELMAHVHIHM